MLTLQVAASAWMHAGQPMLPHPPAYSHPNQSAASAPVCFGWDHPHAALLQHAPMQAYYHPRADASQHPFSRAPWNQNVAPAQRFHVAPLWRPPTIAPGPPPKRFPQKAAKPPQPPLPAAPPKDTTSVSKPDCTPASHMMTLGEHAGNHTHGTVPQQQRVQTCITGPAVVAVPQDSAPSPPTSEATPNAALQYTEGGQPSLLSATTQSVKPASADKRLLLPIPNTPAAGMPAASGSKTTEPQAAAQPTLPLGPVLVPTSAAVQPDTFTGTAMPASAQAKLQPYKPSDKHTAAKLKFCLRAQAVPLALQARSLARHEMPLSALNQQLPKKPAQGAIMASHKATEQKLAEQSAQCATQGNELALKRNELSKKLLQQLPSTNSRLQNFLTSFEDQTANCVLGSKGMSVLLLAVACNHCMNNHNHKEELTGLDNVCDYVPRC